MQQCSWYYGYITPARAEKILQNKPEKSFILRSSRFKVHQKIFTYVAKDGEIRSMKVIDNPRSDFINYFNLSMMQEAVFKMYEISEDLMYPVERAEGKYPVLREALEFKSQVCPVCEEQFDSENSMKNHKNLHHIVKFCTKCQKFIPGTKMTRHRDLCSDRAFVCKDCNKTFVGRRSLKVHEKLHQAGRFSIPCEICDRYFSSRETVELHRVKIHKLSIQCRFCTKMYNCLSSKFRHEKLKHSKTTTNKKALDYEYQDLSDIQTCSQIVYMF